MSFSDTAMYATFTAIALWLSTYGPSILFIIIFFSILILLTN
jgi:hypothetical protein